MVSKVTTRPNGAAIFGCVVMAACLMCSAVFTATAAAADAPVATKTGVLGGNETWEAGSVYAVPTSVVVPDGVTLTVDAGAIVKTNTAATGIVVEPGGTLNVTGSAVSPAVFTSYADDSHGGDSNADGASAGSLNDYASAIEAAGGTLAISHATFDYGTYAITSSPDPEQCSAAPAAAITDSTFHSGVEFEDCASSLSMQRNAFAMPSGYASMPLVAKGVGDASGITLSGADSNTFTGTGVHTMVSLDDFTLPVESAWDISGSAGISVLNFS
ncbi:MAG TPA: hypothetical protein VLF62_00005, partial [Candidatus Saccharimonadales bacterium]|nr:hypothetical protein [Candidatus Saccharimonadales bacterium]